jgi:sterol desaturase/sphingolipid hydroxylase (fatty acid hydroxylase superfamily)
LDFTIPDYTLPLILACIFIPLERLLPVHPEQRMLRGQWANDVFYFLFNGIVVRLCFVAVAGAIMVAYDQVVPTETFAWVTALPLWVQVPAVIVVADIGYYTAHRISHAVPFLWKFHAVHHSIEEMDWLATHRVHPVDQVFTNTLSMLPIYFLDFSLGSVMIYQAFYAAHAMLVHSNVRLNFGPLKYLVASPEYHHWHHANQKEAYDRNFASQLSIIDVVAGTMFLPKHSPEKYGLNEPMPELYHQQMLHPFKGIWLVVRNALRTKAKPRHEQ